MDDTVLPKKKNGNRVEQSRKFAMKAQLDSGSSIRSIARKEKISPATVHAIAHDDSINPEVIEHIKKSFAAKSYMIGDKCADILLSGDKLNQASAYQLAGIRSYSLQDARLCEGESTQNVAFAIQVMNRDHQQDLPEPIEVEGKPENEPIKEGQ